MAAQFQQRSTDRNNPVQLRSNLLSDNIQEKDGQEYYYSVTAGPGPIFFSLQVNSQGAQTYLEVAALDGDNTTLLKFDTTSASKTEKRAQLTLNNRRFLLLRIKGARFNAFGNYRLELKGNFSLNGSPAVPQQDRISKPPLTSRDSGSPRIEILSPPVNRGASVRVRTCQIAIRGQAIDHSPILGVMVNNSRAEIDEQGNFSADVNLNPGGNSITVKAVNAGGKTTSSDFTIFCEGRATDVMGDNSTSAEVGTYHALIIGVQEYQDPGVMSLSHPVSDARRVKETLTRYYTFEPGNVVLLENPDRKKIISTLDLLAEKLMPEDHLLIFYAGHGHWDQKREQGYWLPSDAEQDTRSSWISNADLRDNVRGINANHTLLISDACFSGSLLLQREAFARTPAVEEMLKLKSRTVMTSGAMSTVPDRSVFIRYLVEYLEKNNEPYLFASDLFSNIRKPVIDNSPRQGGGKRPAPQYGTIAEADHRGGDFVLVRRSNPEKPNK